MTPILGIMASSRLSAVGDYESIQTYTLGSSQSTVTFSSIPSTYTHLQIRALAKSTNTSNGNDVSLQLNGDTGTNYTFHQLFGDGASAGAGGAASVSSISGSQITGTNATNTFATMIFDILDYANTNKNKTVRSLGGYDNNGSGLITLRSGIRTNTGAITSLTFFISSWNFAQYSSFALYGIR